MRWVEKFLEGLFFGGGFMLAYGVMKWVGSLIAGAQPVHF
jgi:hypothetical protein